MATLTNHICANCCTNVSKVQLGQQAVDQLKLLPSVAITQPLCALVGTMMSYAMSILLGMGVIVLMN